MKNLFTNKFKNLNKELMPIAWHPSVVYFTYVITIFL